MIFLQTIFSLIVLFVVQVAAAQNTGKKVSAYTEGDVQLDVAVDKQKILIGESFKMDITVMPHPTSKYSFMIPDSIPHFEILEKPVVDTTIYNDGPIIRMVYKLTSFDSGRWSIPSFFIGKGIKTDTIPIDVVFSDFDPNQDYHDIKDIIEVAPTKKKSWWWLIAGGILLLAAFAVYFLRKKKIIPVPAVAVVIDPYKEAIQQMEILLKEKPASKIFHTKLTDIFRLYVFRKKGILSLQKTTADLVLQLKDLNFSKEHFEKLFQALRLSDLVKFAKYIPTEADDMNCFNEINKSITTLEKSESGPPAFDGR